ncbi:MAG TPA: YihY/virulence factor BrkB family protein [Asticcacaulis sp.]|nr:YihY/virulence factor BrkB family protein [Asticcacaulis sp.]
MPEDTPYQRPPLNLQTLGFILRETMREWNDDKVPRLGAALAFYSMLSVGPLLLIVISVASAAFQHDQVANYMFDEIRRLVGQPGADAIRNILANSHNQKTSYIATAIGVVTLVVSATGFFAQLQDALNAIWNVDGDIHSDITSFIRKRILSFAMILGIGFLLLVGLVISAALAAISALLAGIMPEVLLHLLNLIVSFSVITVLFAMIFKILPDVDIKWRDVWIGAAITALLFTFGKQLIGLYLGRSAFSSTYGAAGSLIVVLVWIYYSAQIFFIGAEFTQVYTRYMGRQIVLKRGRRKKVVNTAKEN